MQCLLEDTTDKWQVPVRMVPKTVLRLVVFFCNTSESFACTRQIPSGCTGVVLGNRCFP